MFRFKTKKKRQLEVIGHRHIEVDENIAGLQGNLSDIQMITKDCLEICSHIIEQLEK